MSIRASLKLLIRQLSAILLTVVLLWAFSTILVIDKVLVPYPRITVSDLITLGISLLLAAMLIQLVSPLSVLYSAYFSKHSVIIAAITQKLLYLAALAVVYLGAKALLLRILKLSLDPRTSSIVYDAVFLVIGIFLVYDVIKDVTEAL